MSSFFTIKDVSRIMSVSNETVRRWIRKGELAADDVGGRIGYRISFKQLKDFLQNSKGWSHISLEYNDSAIDKKHNLTIGNIMEIGLYQTVNDLLSTSNDVTNEKNIEILQIRQEMFIKKKELNSKIELLQKELEQIEKTLTTIEGLINEIDDS